MTTVLFGGIFSFIRSYTGVARELVVDDSNQRLRLLDGTTPGGVEFQPVDQLDSRYQPKTPEIDGLTGFAANAKGILTRAGAGVYRLRQIVAGDTGVVITHSDGFDGDFTIALGSQIPGAKTFAEDTTFAKKAIATEFDGPLKGDSTGTHTGGLDARGKTVQFSDGQIPAEAVAGLIQLNEDLDDALNSLVIPNGMIMLWAGNVVDIPTGWHICDGSNGTPNLAGAFIRAATDQTNMNQAGGATSHSHVGHIAAAGSHTHTAAAQGTALSMDQVPKHQHGSGITDDVSDQLFNHGAKGAVPYSPRNVDANNGNGTYEGLTDFVGGDLVSGATNPHSHGVTVDGTGNHTHDVTLDDASNVPPFYRLALIMKIA